MKLLFWWLRNNFKWKPPYAAGTGNGVWVGTCTNPLVVALRCLFRAPLSTFRLICASSWWVERRRSSSSPRMTLPPTLQSTCMTTGPWVSVWFVVPDLLHMFWGSTEGIRPTDAWQGHCPRFCLFSPQSSEGARDVEAMFAFMPVECVQCISTSCEWTFIPKHRRKETIFTMATGSCGLLCVGPIENEAVLKQTWPAVHMHEFCEQVQKEWILFILLSVTPQWMLWGSVCGSSFPLCCLPI